jgi:hypothetical protein
MLGAGEQHVWLSDWSLTCWFAAHMQKRCGRHGLLLAQALERGICLDESRVDGLGMARDQPSGHALRKYVVEQVLESGGR